MFDIILIRNQLRLCHNQFCAQTRQYVQYIQFIEILKLQFGALEVVPFGKDTNYKITFDCDESKTLFILKFL